MNTKKTSKFQTVLMYVVLLVIFIGLFFLLRWFYSTRTESTYTRPTSPVEVEKPEVRTIQKTVTFSSNVSADSIIPVTPYVEGTIIEYYVKEGDYVNEGDVIAKIDPEPYELQYEQATSAYLGYESSFQRIEKLYKTNSVSQQDYDTVKAQRDAMKAQMELAKLQLSYTDVVAHTSGTVLKTISSKGSTAIKGTPIATIADLSDLVINLNLGEKYYAFFANNTEDISITVTRPATSYSEEKTTTASIDAVSPYVDPTSRNFKLYLTLDNPEGFNPGMFVKVTIVLDTKEGYSIKRKTIKLDNSAYYVDEASMTAKYIDLSDAYMNEEYVLLPSGYENESFISKGQNSIFEGQAISIVEDN